MAEHGRESELLMEKYTGILHSTVKQKFLLLLLRLVWCTYNIQKEYLAQAFTDGYCLK